MIYQQAKNKLGEQREMKIANNTYLIKKSARQYFPEQEAVLNDDVLVIRLHNTDILTFFSDGRIVVKSGGYRSKTTKARINDYVSGFKLFSKKRDWYWYNYRNKEEIEFNDGDIICDGVLNGI